MQVLRRLLVALAWLALAVLVALGAAGVATALNPVPGDGSRPELTWAGDQEAAPALGSATAYLEALASSVDSLGVSARKALASLVSGDTAALSSALDAGTVQLAAVSSATASLEAAIANVPFTGDDAALHVSAATTARYAQLAATPSLTGGLEQNWAVLTARALAASSVPALLARHDEEAAAAVQQGEAAHYQKALDLLATPAATLDEARKLRDSLAKTADVTTLTDWINRHAAYDAALATLYKAMLTSKGKVTDAVRKAFAAEEAAKGALPTNTKAIVVIMGDIARGGLNQAVIDIEVARGSLAAALEAQSSPAPAASPTPSAGPDSGGAASPAGGASPIVTTPP